MLDVLQYVFLFFKYTHYFIVIVTQKQMCDTFDILFNVAYVIESMNKYLI